MTRWAAIIVTIALAASTLGLHASARQQVDERLTDPVFLGEVMRHLYRWHLDERDVEPEIARGEFHLRVRELHPALDEGDASRFGEILLPTIGLRVIVKMSDYTVPELDLVVRDDGYHIVRIDRADPSDLEEDGAGIVITLDARELIDRLHATRNRLAPPDDEVLERMQAAAREEIGEWLTDRGRPLPTEPQELHVGPLSPVAHEVWVLWEQEGLLLRFASDLDLADPAAFEHDELTLRIFDIDEQTVVTLHEVAGSNAYMTRDAAARVMFNCLVHGRRVMIAPEQTE